MAKSKFKGVYFNEKKGKYYYATRIKQDDGTFKSIKSSSIYETAYSAFKALEELKETGFKENNPINYMNSKIKEYDKKQETLFKDVALRWLDATKSNKKESSHYCAEMRIKNKLIKIIGETTTINEACKSEVIIEFKEYLSKQELKVATKNVFIFLYKKIVELAFYQGLVSQIEFGNVNLLLPKIKDKVVETNKKENFYTKDEYDQFMKVITEDFDRVLFTFLYYGGFRINELLAITPNDINFEERYISVNKSIMHYSKTMSSPKTKNSYRKVYFNKSNIEMMKNYIESKGIKGDETMFNIADQTVTFKIKKYAKLAGIKSITPHGFRHSCCSMLIQAYIDHNLTINFKQISSHLGDTVDTVYQVYSHLYEDEKKKIIDLL